MRAEANRFQGLRLVSDAGLMAMALVLAYILKFKRAMVQLFFFDMPGGTVYSHAQIEAYLDMGVAVVLLSVLFIALLGGYRPKVGVMALIDEWVVVLKGVAMASMAIMSLTFFYEFVPESRSVMLYTWLLGSMGLCLGRGVWAMIESLFLKKGFGCERTVIIGAGALGQNLAERFLLYPTYRRQLKGFLDDQRPEKWHYHLQDDRHYLGTVSELERVCQEQSLTEVIVASERVSQSEYKQIVGYCEGNQIAVSMVSEASMAIPGSVSVMALDGLVFLVNKQVSYGGGKVMKRGMDVLLALLGLWLCWPIMAVIAVMIKGGSQGPVFYRQERVGKNGATFQMIKFRTMVHNAEPEGPVYVSDGDEDRYIPGGKFLRRFSLDELPQLINVINGEMSVVGPRPERPFFVSKISENLAHFPLRHQVKPGITGWAQVNGRGVLTRQSDQKLKYDLYYIHHWSLVFDIKILLLSVMVVLRGENAH